MTKISKGEASGSSHPSKKIKHPNSFGPAPSRIKRSGAIAVKNSAYVLPSSPGAMELLQWLRRDIASAGGQAWIVEGRFHGGLNDTELVSAFNAQRESDYDALAEECRELMSESVFTPARQAKLARLEKRKTEIDASDFFNAAGKNEVKKMLDDPAPPEPNRLLPFPNGESGSPEATWVSTVWRQPG